MKKLGYLEITRSALLPIALFGFLALALSPSTANAKMSALADDATLKVHVGDVAPLDSDELKKAKSDGKVIVLMFGNVSHCIYCEKTWDRIDEAISPLGKGVVRFARNYRPSKMEPPEDNDAAFGASYGLIGEPWTFFIDQKGVVRHIILGMGDKQEIASEVKKLLDAPPK